MLNRKIIILFKSLLGSIYTTCWCSEVYVDMPLDTALVYIHIHLLTIHVHTHTHIYIYNYKHTLNPSESNHKDDHVGHKIFTVLLYAFQSTILLN